jgi:hypothetical protein
MQPLNLFYLSPPQYRRICQNRRKKSTQFLAKILPVPISPNFFEIHISNYFVCVMNDITSKIEFPKSTLINFYLIAFSGVLNSTHFGYSRHSTYRETPYKIV